MWWNCDANLALIWTNFQVWQKKVLKGSPKKRYMLIWVETLCPNGFWHFFSEYKPFKDPKRAEKKCHSPDQLGWEVGGSGESHFHLLIVAASAPLLLHCRTSKSWDFLKLITSSLFLQIWAHFLLLQITPSPLIMSNTQRKYYLFHILRCTNYTKFAAWGRPLLTYLHTYKIILSIAMKIKE